MLIGAARVGSKSCAQVNAVAGICRIVLQGTIMVMPFSVTVPPTRARSTPGHIDPSSRVADWMKPSMSNCGVGEGACCADAAEAQSRAARATAALARKVWCWSAACPLGTWRKTNRIICVPLENAGCLAPRESYTNHPGCELEPVYDTRI